jgi:hypothetical protein
VPGNKCSTTEQLHAVQELWELMSDDDQGIGDSLTSESDVGHLCVCLFEAAVKGKESPKSMRLLGTIQG